MSQPAKDVVDAPSKNGGPPPYRLYAAMFFAFLLIRFADLATQSMEWTVWVYNSAWFQLGLPLLAMVLSGVTAWRLEPRLPKMMVWMLCGLVGGATTLLTNSAIGVVLGLVVGGFVTLCNSAETSSFWYGVRRAVLRTLIPAVLLGLLAGAIIELSYANFAAPSRKAEMISLGLSAVIGLLLFVFLLRRADAGRGLYWWIVACLLGLVSMPWGILLTDAADSARRRAAMPHAYARVAGPMESIFGCFPSVAGVLTPWQDAVISFVERASPEFHVVELQFADLSTDADARYARGLPFIQAISLGQDSKVTDRGLSQLHLRYVRHFTCDKKTGVGDAFVSKLNPQQMESVRLSGRNFSDEALKHLGSAPNLQYLALPETGVTSTGVTRHLRNAGPLWHLDLSDCQVDDEVLSIFPRLGSLISADLSRTRIRGPGLKHLRGKPLRQLRLDDTPLESKYLLDLLPPPGEPPTFANQIDIGYLSLRRVPLSDEALRALCKLPSLQGLDVTGSDVSPETLSMIVSIPTLRDLGINAESLTGLDFSTVSPSLGSMSLTYDGSRMTITEINTHFLDLMEASRQAGSFDRDSFSIRIKDLALNRDVANDVYELGKMMRISLPDARLPSGEVKTFHSEAELGYHFPLNN